MQQEHWIADRAMLQRLLQLHASRGPNRNWRIGLVDLSDGSRNGSNACVKHLQAIHACCWANHWVAKRRIRKPTHR